MGLKKRTYSIDTKILRSFESAVAQGNRSVVITNLMRYYLSEQEKDRIRTQIIEGSKFVKDLYLEESKAWNPLEEELYGTHDYPDQARRHRARSARPSSRARTGGRSSRARPVS